MSSGKSLAGNKEGRAGNWLRTTQSGGRIQLMIEFAEINEQTYKIWGRGLAKTRKNGNVARDSVVIESSSHPPWCPASELHKWQDPGSLQLSMLGWGRRRRHPCSTLRRSQDRRRPLASSWQSVLPPFVFSLWGDPEDRWLLLRLWQCSRPCKDSRGRSRTPELQMRSKIGDPQMAQVIWGREAKRVGKGAFS